MSRDVIVRFENLKKAFGPKQVLKGVNFEVYRGEAFCIMGPSGCGKSVTIRHVIGLMKSDSGRVEVDGHDMNTIARDELRALRARMGYVFQEAALLNSLSAGENVALPLRETTDLSDREIREKVNAKLALVKVPDVYDKMPSELSGGMKKRVGLARALITDPEIVLYDEPTAGLDPEISASINGLMRELAQELRVTSLIVTHHVGTVRTVADRVGMLDDGELRYIGTADEFLNSTEPRLVRFLGPKLD
ncbi:MAG: ATP-binding cassette domain-containing protein [Planctomycetaceae bacterium]|jgi:phospholipid/cholesterol/gamma-HCH transport system ATP-binding protein|nr:ATP-binding cassette domain-containing protein [Planctomycetaceae bacterium]